MYTQKNLFKILRVSLRLAMSYLKIEIYFLSHSPNSHSGLLPVDPISIKNRTATFPGQCETEHACN